MKVINFKADTRICSSHREELRHFASEAGRSVNALAERLGIKIDFEELPRGKSAVLIRSPHCGSASGYRIAVNRRDTVERQRFSVAHELAHFVLHRRDPDFEAVEDDEDYGSVVPLFELKGNSFRSRFASLNRSDRLEQEADIFAATLLMPPNLIRRSAAFRRNDLPTLAKEFRVSRQAMLKRLRDIGYSQPTGRTSNKYYRKVAAA